MCQQCHSKPCHPGHPFCGKTCARAYQTVAQMPQQQICLNCQLNPCHQGHPFCGKTCAQAYQTLPPQQQASVAAPVPAAAVAPAVAAVPQLPQQGMCVQCCKNPCYVDTTTGKTHRYCSKGCATAADAKTMLHGGWGSDVRTMYHITSKDAGSKIEATGQMLRGNGGWAGGGIYFTNSVQQCKAKCPIGTPQECLITAQVELCVCLFCYGGPIL